MGKANKMAADADLEMDELLARVDHDLQLLRELLDIFKEDAPVRMQALREAIGARDATKVATEAHALKGMLANLSAKRACEAAGKIEQLALAEKANELAGAFAGFEQLMQDVMSEVDACLSGAAL